MAGDFVQGSVYDTLFGADIAIDMYKTLRYDIATLGNHEFDKGPDPVYRTITETSATGLVWVASNLHFVTQPKTFPIHAAALVGGICWVGALTEKTIEISSPGTNVSFGNVADSIAAALPACGVGAQAVIAVTHQGYDHDVALCSLVPELNLVIGGHSHTHTAPGARYPTKVTRYDGTVCYVVQARAFGRYVGVLDVVFGKDEHGHRTFDFEGYQYVPMDWRIPLDAALKATMRWKWDVSSLVNKPVGSTTHPIDASNCRRAECMMGNLVCDAMLAFAGEKQGAVACMQNGGGLRASLDEGDITLYGVLTVLPFANVDAVITLPGAGVLKALENGFLALSGEDTGRFPQMAGMTVEVDSNGAPGRRVRKVIIGGEPLEVERLYTIVTNKFMAGGGDGYFWEGASNVELSGRGLDTLVSEYLAAHTPYTPFTEGRIIDVSGM